MRTQYFSEFTSLMQTSACFFLLLFVGAAIAWRRYAALRAPMRRWRIRLARDAMLVSLDGEQAFEAGCAASYRANAGKMPVSVLSPKDR